MLFVFARFDFVFQFARFFHREKWEHRLVEPIRGVARGPVAYLIDAACNRIAEQSHAMLFFFIFCKFPGISYYVGHVFLVELNPPEPFPISKGCPAVQGLSNTGF